jgi:predicted permease
VKFRSQREDSLRSEIRDHLAREIADNITDGMSTEDARHAALRKFGPVLRATEDTRAVWVWTWLEQLWHDVLHGARMFAKNPGFTIVAVVSLAFGIGANCAMFSAADALILRPLTVSHPEEVVAVGSEYQFGNLSNSLYASYPDYVDLRDRSQSFDGLVACGPIRASVAFDKEAAAQVKVGSIVSANFFRVLGIEPELGRGFRPEDEAPATADALVVLSHDTWAQNFDSKPDVLGKKIQIGGIEFIIIGVSPDRFTSLERFRKPAFFVATAMWPKLIRPADLNPLEARGYRSLTLEGRLKHGVSVATARAEIGGIGRGLEQLYPTTNQGHATTIRTQLEENTRRDPIDTELIGLLTALSAAVLFVACANVAGLLTSRAPVRAREIALRLAIGAGRARLIRQLLTESLMIATAGELLSIPIAYIGILVFRQIQFPFDGVAVPPMYIDQRAMLFSLAVGLASSLLFGLAPAIQTTRADLASALKSADVAKPGRRRLWGRNLLVTAQVAISLVLLTMATFANRAFRKELTHGMGFRSDHMVMMSFDPSLQSSKPGPVQLVRAQRFYEELMARVRVLPGVKSAALASSIPLAYRESTPKIQPEGFRFPPGQDGATILTSRVSTDYFDVMAVPILRGRAFRVTDSEGAPRVAVVNEYVAQHYWPAQDPIGKRFRFNGASGPGSNQPGLNATWIEVVGVAKGGRYLYIAESPTEFVYLPSLLESRISMTLLA